MSKEKRILKKLSLTSFIGSFIEPLVGIVTGHIALSEYKKLDDSESKESRGFAVAGLVLGYLGLALRLAFVGFMFLSAMLSYKYGPSIHYMPYHY